MRLYQYNVLDERLVLRGNELDGLEVTSSDVFTVLPDTPGSPGRIWIY